MPDNSSFEEIYKAHVKMVFNLCLNYLQNSSDSEEVTQDVFVKVHDQIAKFEKRSGIKTWIYRIAVNQCLDFLKAKKRKKRQGFLIPLFSVQENFGIAVSSFDHPGVKLENKEATERIFGYINTLPERQKTALLLKAVEGLSLDEIAEIMSLSKKAVESLLGRAKLKLKEKIAESEGSAK